MMNDTDRRLPRGVRVLVSGAVDVTRRQSMNRAQEVRKGEDSKNNLHVFRIHELSNQFSGS
jgi:hypothetical protein